MDLDISIEQSKVRITILGAVDTAGGSELSTKFAELARDPSLMHAEFDLSEVPSITSAGIGKLLAFFKHFDQAGGGMRIVGLSPQLEKQFKEIHLDQIIPMA